MVFWITGGAIVVLVIYQSITSWAFILGSEKRHPELWEHAGEPSLLGDGDIFNGWPLTKYLLERDYLQLDNKTAIAYADKRRGHLVLSFFAAWLAIAVFFICLFIPGAQN